MAVRQIQTEISLSGEKSFNDQMKAINSNLKNLKSDMKLVSSEFADNANSVEALRAKQAVLQQQYDQQGEKVNALRAQLQAVSEAYGEDSAQADKYRQQLNEATIQQNNFARELNATSEALGKAQDPLSGVKSALHDLVSEKVDNLTHPLEGVKEKLKNMTADDIKAGLQNLKGHLGEVWDTMKQVPLDALQGAATALFDMGKAVFNQTKESAAYADEILSLSTKTGISTSRLQEYKYMAELTDTSLETITGSLTKLTKNMDSARGGTGAAAEAFEKLGIAVADEDGALLDNEVVFNKVISALGLMEDGTERDALAMELFGKKATDLNSLIAVGGEGLKEYAQEAHDAGAVLDSDTLTALGAVDDSLHRFNNTLAAAKNAIGAEFAEPVGSIMDGLTALMRGDIDEGMGMIIDGLDQTIEILDGAFPMVEEFLAGLVNLIIEHLPDLLSTGIELIVHLLTGIAQTAPQLIPQMISVILTMVQTLTSPDNLSQLVTAGIQLILQLALGLVRAIPELVPALLQAIVTIVDTIWAQRDQIVEAGRDLIRGLWEGIQNMGAWLWQQVSGFFSGLVGGIKGFFGIASPSRLFRDEIGRNLALGIGEGFAEEMDDVNREMLDAVNTDFSLTPNVALQRGMQGGQAEAASAAREDIRAIGAALVNGLQTAASGAQGLPSGFTVNLVLPDGTSILRYFIDLARANGTPIVNPT